MVYAAKKREARASKPETTALQPEEVAASVLELPILAGILNKVADRDLEQQLQAQSAGISAIQYRVIRLLSQHTATITDLSRMMAVSPATLVSVVDGLERQGLVQRGHDPADRRRTPLRLTETGEALLRRLPCTGSSGSLARGLAELGEARSRELAELLRQLVLAVYDDGRAVQRVHEAARSPEDGNGASQAKGSTKPQQAA